MVLSRPVVKLGRGNLQDAGWGFIRLKARLYGSRARYFNNYFSYNS